MPALQLKSGISRDTLQIHVFSRRSRHAARPVEVGSGSRGDGRAAWRRNWSRHGAEISERGAEMGAEMVAEIAAEIGADFFLNKIRPNMENMCVIDVPPVPNSQPHRRQFRRQFRLPVHKFRRHFSSISEISAPFRLHFGPTRAKDRWTGRGGCRPEATEPRPPKQVEATRRNPNLLNETDTQFNKIIKK